MDGRPGAWELKPKYWRLRLFGLRGLPEPAPQHISVNRVRFVVLIPLLLSLSACSAKQTGTPGNLGALDSGPDYDPTVVSVPFLVDDQFIPSGCMGDCASNVVIDSDCPARAANDAQGECHHFIFTADTSVGALGWAGVLWQTTEKNWGSQPGRVIAPGATTMHFYAAGKAGGEALNIIVGGMVPGDAGKPCDVDSVCSSLVCRDGSCTAPYHDTLDIVKPVKLDSTFTDFEIPFGDNSYGGQVLSGFGWTAAMPKDATQIEFYVDDLRWE